jgi:hypothetical protein
MSFITAADLAKAESFRTRVKMAAVRIAGTVLNENVANFGGVQAQKRLALAQAVLRDPDAQVNGFIYPVISNPAIAQVGLDATDGDFEFQVASVWDSVAGVSIADRAPAPTGE